MENLPTKENTSNSVTIGEEISSDANENIFSDVIISQIPSLNSAQSTNETCLRMNQTVATPSPDNIMSNDTNNPTRRNKVWKNDAKLLALKSFVQWELSTLGNKTYHIETFNKAISNFETKPCEILQDNVEFMQNELCSKDEVVKTLMETQTAVLENLSLGKQSQQTENNTSFHDSPQKNLKD